MSVPRLTSGTGNLSVHCIADSAGGLTFDLDLPGLAAARHAGTGDSWATALVLRRRGGDTAADEVRLPLVPFGASGPSEGGTYGGGAYDPRLRAVLPSTVVLPEGRWDAYAGIGEGEPERVRPGVLDLRSLVDRRPDTERPSVAARVPYATRHGNLTVRAWLRAPHAEAGEILIADGAMTVHGRLYGARLRPGAVVEAVCRGELSPVRSVPVARRGGSARGPGAGRPRGTGGGASFAFTLALAELAGTWRGARQAWDLRLRPAADAEPVRIARILDDVPDKSHIVGYPTHMATRAPYGTVEAGPYYTLDNDLAVRIEQVGQTGQADQVDQVDQGPGTSA